MNHKYLMGTAVAAALLFGAQAASACAISAWSSATGLTVADTGEPTAAGFKRYSGRCSLRVPDSNGGAGRLVTDTTPSAEASYRVRFYYFTGNISGATTDIFQAQNTGGSNLIRVTHDGNQLGFSSTATGGTAQNIVVQDERYYAVEIAWAAGSPGSMNVTVTGAGSSTPAGTLTFSLTNSADRIETARMGMISGNPTVTVAPNFDEFDSRRTQNPGRLCRGDANGNGTLTGGDAQAVINETVNGVLAAGQPDANENGSVTGGDAQAIINFVVNLGATCPN